MYIGCSYTHTIFPCAENETLARSWDLKVVKKQVQLTKGTAGKPTLDGQMQPLACLFCCSYYKTYRKAASLLLGITVKVKLAYTWKDVGRIFGSVIAGNLGLHIGLLK